MRVLWASWPTNSSGAFTKCLVKNFLCPVCRRVFDTYRSVLARFREKAPVSFRSCAPCAAFFAFALRANGRAGNSILGSCRNLPCAHLARISPWGPFPLQKKHANKGASPSGGPLIARQASVCLTRQRRRLLAPVPAPCPDLRADPTGADPAGRPPSGRRCARSPGPRPWPGRRPGSSPG